MTWVRWERGMRSMVGCCNDFGVYFVMSAVHYGEPHRSLNLLPCERDIISTDFAQDKDVHLEVTEGKQPMISILGFSIPSSLILRFGLKWNFLVDFFNPFFIFGFLHRSQPFFLNQFKFFAAVRRHNAFERREMFVGSHFFQHGL